MMHLETVVRLERDPLDVMGRLHGMLGRADRHLDEAALVLNLDDRSMLLDGTVARIGVEHLITRGSRSLDLQGSEEVVRVILIKRSHIDLHVTCAYAVRLRLLCPRA